MNKSYKWPATAAGGAAVAAALALPGGVAYANTNPPPLNAGNTSVASGNQALLSLNLPVDVCGVAIALLGSADAGCQGGATVAQSAPLAASSGGGSGGTNVGNTSAGSANKVSAPISVPINVCGVSVAILGTARSGCQGGSTVGNPPPGTPGSPSSPGSPGGPGVPGNPGGPSIPPGGKPPCHGTKHHKPPKHHVPPKHHKKAGGSPSGGSHGGSAGGSSSTQTTSTAMLTSGSLPTTGVNLLGVLAAALGCIATGTGALVARRRHRGQEA